VIRNNYCYAQFYLAMVVYLNRFLHYRKGLLKESESDTLILLKLFSKRERQKFVIEVKE